MAVSSLALVHEHGITRWSKHPGKLWKNGWLISVTYAIAIANRLGIIYVLLSSFDFRSSKSGYAARIELVQVGTSTFSDMDTPCHCRSLCFSCGAMRLPKDHHIDIATVCSSFDCCLSIGLVTIKYLYH